MVGHLIDLRPCEGVMLHAVSMGQFVPFVKDNVSPDFNSNMLHNRRMAITPDEARFNDELCARVARLRAEREWTQDQMATALGVPKERYKKYETRSPMPTYLIPRFAQIMDCSIEYVMTGKAPKTERGAARLVRTGTDG